jgi:hypothetical protein
MQSCRCAAQDLPVQPLRLPAPSAAQRPAGRPQAALPPTAPLRPEERRRQDRASGLRPVAEEALRSQAPLQSPVPQVKPGREAGRRDWLLIPNLGSDRPAPS